MWSDVVIFVTFARILGLDLVVRDDSGNALDPESSSTVSLFRAHETASRGIDEYIQEEKVGRAARSWDAKWVVTETQSDPDNMRESNPGSALQTVHCITWICNIKEQLGVQVLLV